MELSQLETFLMVVSERSFSRAAARLHRTQPAISQVIRKLEEEFGEQLFERSSRDGTLTAAGEVLREYAERLLRLRNEAVSALEEVRSLERGRLTLAANEYTCLYLLPVLAEFRRLHPMIRISVQRSAGTSTPSRLVIFALRRRIVFGSGPGPPTSIVPGARRAPTISPAQAPAQAGPDACRP